MSKKALAYYLTFIAFLGGGVLIYRVNYLPAKEVSFEPAEEARVIELRENGFHPAEMTIKTGDIVTFTSTRGKEFWPASDPHPIHNYLQGFEPGNPLIPDEHWSYLFEEPGTWRYHDHLSVSFRGEITVLDANAQKVASKVSPQEYCNDDGECFDELIRDTVKKEGIDAAYTLFSEEFAAGRLPRACHWTAHQIGEAAYELFREGEEFPITYATSYCGYGFYHGFLEGLLRENPDTDYALSFCSRVEKQLGKLGLWNCYHGIGHGFTEDPPDPRVWGDFKATVKPGIEICEYLFGDSFPNLNLCLTGVFTVPVGFAEKGEFGFSLDPEDPFTACSDQDYRYHKACYGEFAPKLDSLPDWNLSRLPKLLENIDDAKTIRLVVWVVPSTMIARDIMSDDFTKYIHGCRDNFKGRLKNICLGGTILGFFTHGEPEKQYIKALQFCASNELLKDEKDTCYAEVAHRMRQEYGSKKIEQACKMFPGAYEGHCFDNDYRPAYDDPSFDQPPEVDQLYGKDLIIFKD